MDILQDNLAEYNGFIIRGRFPGFVTDSEGDAIDLDGD